MCRQEPRDTANEMPCYSAGGLLVDVSGGLAGICTRDHKWTRNGFTFGMNKSHF